MKFKSGDYVIINNSLLEIKGEKMRGQIDKFVGKNSYKKLMYNVKLGKYTTVCLFEEELIFDNVKNNIKLI